MSAAARSKLRLTWSKKLTSWADMPAVSLREMALITLKVESVGVIAFFRRGPQVPCPAALDLPLILNRSAPEPSPSVRPQTATADRGG